MDVKEFVSETLKQVHSGINEANEGTENPRFGTTGRARIQMDSPGIFQDNWGVVYTTVDFDLAVTVAGEKEGGGRLKVPYFEAGASGKKATETVSRVKFSVSFRLE
ncbi:MULTISPECIES: trypco2 family protein [Salipiger]|uniref:trypco2 family protein n=1 Tax=Salipiger TaxID=263377 RepID=UPI00351263E4